MTTNPQLFLRPCAVVQPLIHRWFAWPYLAVPHTGALNLRGRLLPILRRYVHDPKELASSIKNPYAYAQRWLAPAEEDVRQVAALLDETERRATAKLRLADDIDQLRELLRRRATGSSLESLYPEVPPSLRGAVELLYDTASRPSFRFFEPLLYRGPAFEQHAQTISLTATPETDQSFVYGSPVLARQGRLDINIPFAARELDALFLSRISPVDVAELSERLGVPARQRKDFGSMFTDSARRPQPPLDDGIVRMRYFGHAGVLLECRAASVLVDPLIGYAGDGHDHYTVDDLPNYIDVIVISHLHSDHLSLETILQLRSRVGTVVVPRSSGGSLQDPSIRTLLEAVGVPRVVEVGPLETFRAAEELEVVALPFLGEHADLDVRAKMMPLVRLAGRAYLLATDATLAEPALYDRLRDVVDGVDALFIGLEFVGAPLKWLYGPLLEGEVSAEANQSRRLNGATAKAADRLAQLVDARHVYAYGVGLEPWLRHHTGSEFEHGSVVVTECEHLLRLCQQRGVPANLLYQRAERYW